MYDTQRKLGFKVAALSLGLAMMVGVSAQESDEVAGGEAAAVAAAARPEAAEMAPLASTQQLTNLARAGERLVAVGARGHILVSSDGSHWTQVPVPVSGLLTAVAFADDKRGWAVGHDAAILHTVDGGQTWTLQNFQPELSKPLLDVLFLDANHGFAVGAYGLFLQTTDGGAHWTQIEAPIVEEQLHFNALTRLGNGSLLLIGEEGMMALSADQGQTWQRLQSPIHSSQFAVLAEGERGALIAGLRGNVYRTADVQAGPWNKVETGDVQSVFGLAALPGGEVAMAGLNASLLLLDRESKVRRLPIGTPAVAATAPDAPPLTKDAPANDKELGAFSGAMAWKDALVVVGESGVRTVKIAR